MIYPLTDVRWFHSGMADAPVLRGEVGALIELLDACLINGFSPRTLNSLVVSGGVATATISAGNPYDRHAVVRIAGASIAALNGDHRIDTAGASTFTFPAPGAADGAATGTITVKRSPAGWNKAFSGTNKAAYQSADESSTQLYLRVDDTEALYTNVRGYENLTDIDTGTGMFPTAAQQANYYWTKSSTSNSTARPWVLVSNGSMVWFVAAWSATYSLAGMLNQFGDIAPYSAGDGYGCTIAANTATKGTSSPWSYGHPATLLAGNRYVARLSSGASGAALYKLIALSPESAYFSTFGSSYPAVDTGGGCQIGPKMLAQDGAANTSQIRGVFAGIRPVLQLSPFAVASGIVCHPQEVEGEVLLPVSVTSGGSSSIPAQTAFDIIGPW